MQTNDFVQFSQFIQSRTYYKYNSASWSMCLARFKFSFRIHWIKFGPCKVRAEEKFFVKLNLHANEPAQNIKASIDTFKMTCVIA